MHHRHGPKEQPAACRLEQTPGGCDLIKKQVQTTGNTLHSQPCRGGGGGLTPTYMAQNDPHVVLIILTAHMRGGNFLVGKTFSGQNLCSGALDANIHCYTKQRAQHRNPFLPLPPLLRRASAPPPPGAIFRSPKTLRAGHIKEASGHHPRATCHSAIPAPVPPGPSTKQQHPAHHSAPRGHELGDAGGTAGAHCAPPASPTCTAQHTDPMPCQRTMPGTAAGPQDLVHQRAKRSAKPRTIGLRTNASPPSNGGCRWTGSSDVPRRHTTIRPDGMGGAGVYSKRGGGS